jgi:alkaline phosphatase D
MRIDRRGFLSLAGLAAAPAAASAPTKPAPRFAHGVASGDPQQDRVILWTRLTSTDGASRSVAWEVARDEAFTSLAAKGTAVAAADRDFTVKVDVTGLSPGTDYFYRFRAGAAVSPVGRTRTLAAGAAQEVVLAVASCTLYPNGYFHAYQAIAEEPRLDVVLHLGDYIYEFGRRGFASQLAFAIDRESQPAHELLTLEDYRRRHAQYRTDPDLAALHAKMPMIAVWDDHDFADNAWSGGAVNHDPATEGSFTARRAAAVQAYREWLPVRLPDPANPLKI